MTDKKSNPQSPEKKAPKKQVLSREEMLSKQKTCDILADLLSYKKQTRKTESPTKVLENNCKYLKR
jgi:hypothetical protein